MLPHKPPVKSTSNTNMDNYSVSSTGHTDGSHSVLEERVSSRKEFHESMSNRGELGIH